METILILSKKKPVVRSVDIAVELGFSKPSVSVAVKNMKAQGLITVTPEGYIYLTPTGLQIAGSVYERHQILTGFLIRIGVSEKVAEEDACRIEHIISEETFGAIKNIAEVTMITDAPSDHEPKAPLT